MLSGENRRERTPPAVTVEEDRPGEERGDTTPAPAVDFDTIGVLARTVADRLERQTVVLRSDGPTTLGRAHLEVDDSDPVRSRRDQTELFHASGGDREVGARRPICIVRPS